MPSLSSLGSPASAQSSFPRQRALRLLTFVVFTCAAALAHAQKFTQIVVFGDSLSDVGNVAHLTQSNYGIRIPGLIVNYADGRFTDGIYTSPAAQRYNGVWVEQLASMLRAKPTVKASLDGGTDYAYGSATTAGGTSLLGFGPTNAFPVNVDNIGAQISTYLATHPKIGEKTLFIVWGGAIDLLHATSQQAIVNGAINETSNIQRLIDAGARNFIIPNLPPLGLIPRLNGSPFTSIPATQASALFNQFLAQGISVLQAVNPGRKLRLHQMDVFALFNQVAANPADFGLVNVTSSSQYKPVTPDDYLFWDDLHPTTRVHNILALNALSLLDPDRCRDNAAYSKECEPEHEQVQHEQEQVQHDR